ncbi:hypothetical protein [Myxococcus phage Mx1]|nr:hypothetical protein [Myxococcus phage Mx1]
MNIFVSWSIDHLEGLIAAALMAEHGAELRRVSGDVRRATENMKAWAIASGGSPVLDLGAVGVLEVPADKMTDLPSQASRFEDIADATASIGVGMTLSESYTAMRFSQINGGDRISLYEPEMDDAVHNAQSPGQEDPLEALGKNQKVGMEGPVGYADDQGDEGLGDTPPSPEYDPGQNAPPPETMSAGPAQAPEMSGDPNGGPPPADGDGGGQEEQPDARTVVVQALQKIKEQAPILEQIKQSNPEAFEAVKGVIGAMILMAQGMTGGGGEEPVQKSEGSDIPKAEDANQQRIQHLVATTHGSTWRLPPRTRTGKTVAGVQPGYVVVTPDQHNLKQWRATVVSHSGLPTTHSVAADHAGALALAVKAGANIHGEPHSVRPAEARKSAPTEESSFDPEPFDKASLPMPKPTPKRQHHVYPVGTAKDGKVKVSHVDPATGAPGGTGWHSVRAGQVMSEDGHAISSRNPGGK